MTRVRNEILQKLWRGKDPFLSDHARVGVPDLQGWGSQHRYLTECIDTLHPSVIVEVGVWKGASTIHMATRLRDLGIDGVVIAVDTWLGSWEHWTEDRWFRELGLFGSNGGMLATFLRNVRDAGLENYIVPMPLDSINAAQVLRKFDIFPNVIHIDGGHDHATVLADIVHWWPMLTPGGLLIGDDYRAGNDWPGVKRAFDDYFRPLGLNPLENIDEKCRVSKPSIDARASLMLSEVKLIGSMVSKWREALRLELVALIEGEAPALEELLDRFVRFEGPRWPEGRRRVMDQVVEKLRTGGHDFNRGDIFGAEDEINADAVRTVVPGFTAHYLRPAPADEFERFELLPPFENPLAHLALPGSLNRNMGSARAPSFATYRATACDLFVTPIGYQLFRAAGGIYYPAASTRAYPQEAMVGPHVDVNNCVVIVQDVFEGSNFSHFLFDWVPRIGHFVNAGLEERSTCTFILGGIPTEFHFHVVLALCEIYSLNEKQFVFPRESQVWHIAGPTYFFSEAKWANMHPAHMAHRRSIAIVREVCDWIPTPSGKIKKVYISRGDTTMRKIANEPELFDQLKAFGFVEIQLGFLPWLEQVEVFRGADVIVAPHGMGLTHLAFHHGRPLIVELHNPALGTDTYAFPAHALGFRYRAVLGADLGGFTNHFDIDPRDVVNVLLEEGLSPVADSGPAQGLHTRFFGGVQSTAALEVLDLSPRRPGHTVHRHTRDRGETQPDNNCGWLEVDGLIKGAKYHCRCEVWIPTTLSGDSVTLSCSDLAASVSRPAALGLNEQWQTITITGVAIRSMVNFVLRCDADAGGVFYTSEWRVGAGSAAD